MIKIKIMIMIMIMSKSGQLLSVCSVKFRERLRFPAIVPKTGRGLTGSRRRAGVMARWGLDRRCVMVCR